MFGSIVLAGFGVAALAWSSGQLVVGASRISLALRVSPVLVGLVVIGLGTSAPELVVSTLGAHRGELDLAVGAIVGSNFANLTLVLGVATVGIPIATTVSVVRREAPLAAALTVALALAIQGGLSRTEAALLLAGFAAVLALILATAFRQGGEPLGAEVEEFTGGAGEGARHRVGAETARALGGLTGVVVGAQALVEGARSLADDVGLSGGFVA